MHWRRRASVALVVSMLLCLMAHIIDDARKLIARHTGDAQGGGSAASGMCRTACTLRQAGCQQFTFVMTF